MDINWHPSKSVGRNYPSIAKPQLSYTAIELTAWMSNYTLYKSMDIDTWLYTNGKYVNILRPSRIIHHSAGSVSKWNKRHAIIWTTDILLHWRIYASFGPPFVNTRSTCGRSLCFLFSPYSFNCGQLTSAFESSHWSNATMEWRSDPALAECHLVDMIHCVLIWTGWFT